jgi:hypothetical protein
MGAEMQPEKENPSGIPVLSHHILPNAVTMVGVCVTLIGLVKLAEARIGPSRVDEYTALTAFLFLASGIASYIAIRHAGRPHLGRRCERIADGCFLLGLIGIAVIALFFAYEII